MKRDNGVTFLGNDHFLVQAGLGVLLLVNTMVDHFSTQKAGQNTIHLLSECSSDLYNRLLHPP